MKFVVAFLLLCTSCYSVQAGKPKSGEIDVDVPLINLIQNSEFDDGTSGWQLGDWSGAGYTSGGNSMSAVSGADMSGTNALFIDIVNANNESWTIQPKQILNFSLEVGKTYSISFMAKAESSRVISAALRGEINNIDFWHTDVNLTTNLQQLSFQYTCTNQAVNNESNFSIAFYLAKGVVSDVWIDKVIVEDITSNTPVAGVMVSPSTVTLSVQQSAQLTESVFPFNATNKNVYWVSANPSVASVSNTGLVSAVGPGSTTVTVTTEDGSYSAVSAIIVQGGFNGILNGEFDQGTSDWALGDWTGANYSNGGNSFTTVTNAAMSGTSALFVDVVNNNNENWTLQVRQQLNFRIEVGKIYNISFWARAESDRTMGVAIHGETSDTDPWAVDVNLTTNTQLFTFQYVCDNPDVENEAGFALAFYLARGVISDVWIDNVVLQDVTLSVPVTGISVTPENFSISAGQTAQLVATITPTNATNQQVIWSSGSNDVATVSNTGLVTPVGMGTAIITAKSVDGNFTNTAIITVEQPGSNSVLNPEFDLGIANWFFGDWSGPDYSNGGNVFTVVNNAGMSGENALHVDIVNNNNSSSWTIQPKQTLPFLLKTERTYLVSFMAKAESNRAIDVALRGENTNVDFWLETVDLTTTIQTFSFEYICDDPGVTNESEFALAFYLAKGVLSDVWIDNVMVADITNVGPDTDAVTSVRAQYNGIITSMRWRTDEAFGTDKGEFSGMYLFDYDDKYQIKRATWATPNFVTNTFSSTGNKFLLAGMEYDPNGNIMQLRRYNSFGEIQHDFKYHHKYENDPANQNTPRQFNNQLQSVEGYVNLYEYNSLGQMVGADKIEGEDQYVEYDVTGKVTKVYSNQAMGPEHLKMKNLYDDRGFRLAKINYETNLTTWYIRDGSGNVISIYEQQGTKAGSKAEEGEEEVEDLRQEEVPIYASGKLGTYYPFQDGSANYEITDHLGNVRALIRDNISIYTASMEDNGAEGIHNPRNEELLYFQNIEETVVADYRMNHTEMAAGVQPDKASYLFWNDTQGTLMEEKAIGPAVALRVQAGDVFELETWVRYERKNDYTHDFGVVALSALLGNTFGASGGFEGLTINSTISNLEGALTAGLFPDDGGDDTRPFAYLNYIVYDQNMVFQTAGWKRVTDDAGFYPEEIGLPEKKPVRVKFDDPIVIDGSGYIYVWVSNQSKETRVWFDDLRVTHTQSIVVQATDYGVWGDVLREQKTDETIYRFGYQGQYAEKDEETGWNHFELREYDPVVGRWTAVDPKRIGWSPYIGMANNPLYFGDPDGGGPNDYYRNNATGQVVWIEGSGAVEGYTHLSANSLDPSVINAVSTDISNRGFDAFLGYFNDSRFGTDYFFDLANTFNVPRAGWLGEVIDQSLIVKDGFQISEWTHTMIANGTPEGNQLEHHIGTFLMTSRWGPGAAQVITTANEVRGLIINDRQAGNAGRALRGLPGRNGRPTAFEWSDLKNNIVGAWEYAKYHLGTYVFNKDAWFNSSSGNVKTMK